MKKYTEMKELTKIEDCLRSLAATPSSEKSTYEFKGKIVPRVTEIISGTINEEYLLLWSNSLGFKHLSYREELQKAADIGTFVHNEIDIFLKEGIEGKTPSFMAFKRWYEPIKDRSKILGNEESLVCEWFGGTYDMLIEIDGKIFLVDFKTSNHLSFRHFMQLSAYRYMLYYVKGININGVIVLQLHKQRPEFREYVLDFSIPEHYNYIEHCTRAFMAAVYAYYTRIQVQGEMEEILHAGGRPNENNIF